MAAQTDRISIVTSAALFRGDRVKLDAAALTVSPSAATEGSIGVVDRDWDSGDLAEVDLLSSAKVFELRALTAFAVGATLYGAAAGEVDDVVNVGVDRFRALEAATAANDIVRCIPIKYSGA